MVRQINITSQDAALLVFISCELLTVKDSYIERKREACLHQRISLWLKE